MSDDKGIYYFHQGTNYQAYKMLGAHYQGNETIFRVYAPHAKSVSVIGDFNGWNGLTNPMQKINNEGIWEGVSKEAKPFDCYQYLIETYQNEYLYKSDPFAFHSELRPAKASKIYDIECCYRFTDHDWMNQRVEHQSYHKPLNIYELHLGSWRRYEDGQVFDYRKLGVEISNYAKEMGYTHIEIMPINEYPYDPSWGYQVTGFFSITSRYGTPADFMDFVNICHNNGIGVIVDWVPGHFAKDAHGLVKFDGEYVYEDPNPKRMEHQGWGTRIFNFGKTEVQSFLVSSAIFLLDKFHIDGLRVDAVAAMLYLDFGRQESVTNTFGSNINLEAKAFLEKVNTVVHEMFPGVITIAEESTAFPKITSRVNDGGLGFDYKWNMGWMNDTLSYIKTDPLYRSYHHHQLSFQMTYIYSEHYILALSHDEVVHMKGSMINKMPGEYYLKFANLKSYYTYQITHPGKKLIFMGGEIGQFREWSENREIDWSVLQYEPHQKLQKYLKDLNRIYLDYPALYDNDESWNGFRWISVDDNQHNIFSYARISKNNQQLIVIINFANATWNNYAIYLENGEYEIILDSEDLQYGGFTYRLGQKFQVHDGCLQIDLPPCCGVILKKIN